MLFGVIAPTAEEWRILERMKEGEHLYIEGWEDNSQTDAFTWTGKLARSPDDERVTHIDGRQLNSMRGGDWIVYDRDRNECVLTGNGNQALRLYRPSTTSNRCVKKKPSER
jgi:hypothetical protein